MNEPVTAIDRLASENSNFRSVLYTGHNHLDRLEQKTKAEALSSSERFLDATTE